MRIRKKVWSSDTEPIVVIMAVLLMLGTINVFSSSFVLATTDFNNPYYFLIRHVIWLALGIVVCFVLSRTNYHRWQSPMATMGFFFIVALLLALVLVLGVTVNGARRWLSLGGFSLQPAEFAKLVGIIFAAKYLTIRMKLQQQAKIVFAPTYWLLFALFALIELEPDMGTACIVIGIPILMAVIVGMHGRELKGLVVVCVAGASALIFLQPYRLQRVKTMFDPWADAQGIGYQTVQSLSTIGSGGLFGMGLGDGVSKYEYLPEAHTDFAFAIFAQEHGYVGSLMVFLLFLLLVLCCARVAARAKDAYGQVLAMGIMLLVAGQAAANLLMVAGIGPVVGVPLPFISYGGSSLIVTMMAMGILLNICKQGAAHQKFRRMQAAKEKREQALEQEKARQGGSARLYRVK